MIDLLHGLIRKPILYLGEKLSARQFLIFSGILVGLTSGLAAVAVKYVVHSIGQLVTFYSGNYEEFFSFCLVPDNGDPAHGVLYPLLSQGKTAKRQSGNRLFHC